MKLFLYTFIFTAMFFCGCLVNDGETTVLNSSPTGKFSPLKTPLVCAYMHIGNRKLTLKDMRLDGVDILNLAFTKITNNRVGLIHSSDAQNFMIAKKVREKYPSLKILVSVGGYGTAEVFSKMCFNDSTRAIFVDDAVRFVRYYSLDGIDVDWEFPGMNRNTREADKENFTSLLKELRAAFDKASKEDGKKYLLTIAAGAFELYLSYTDIRAIIPLTDYFFLMTYDFFGQWNKHTGHHTNLYLPESQNSSHSVEKITSSYIKKGVPPEKIIIGAAFYGRKWKNVEAEDNGLFKSGKGVGSVPYSKIVPLTKNPKYIRYWDSTAYAPTLYNMTDKIFISYEDEESVRRKVDYVFIKNLGGLMYWEYFSDYQLTLSKAIKSEFEINKGEYTDFRLPLNVNIKKVKK
ncbi:MAG: glycoside hydrolase family 18 protein [Bacteroidales bacterium]|nr:glycoside hydrolase family 18 protein [Bacteroidales bacterium]